MREFSTTENPFYNFWRESIRDQMQPTWMCTVRKRGRPTDWNVGDGDTAHHAKVTAVSVGEVAEDRVHAQSATVPPTVAVTLDGDWSFDQACEWLCKVDGGRYQNVEPLFRSKRISARALLHMNSAHFRRMGIDETLSTQLQNAINEASAGMKQPQLVRIASLSAVDCPPMSQSRTVSVIGTSGRKEDGARMSADLFRAMVDACETIIRDELKLSAANVHLVSGGAAWAGSCMLFFFFLPFLTPSHELVCPDCRSRGCCAVSDEALSRPHDSCSMRVDIEPKPVLQQPFGATI